MFKTRTILIIGIWTAILPYLGFPILIKNTLFSLTGLALIYLSLVMYKEWRKVNKVYKKPDSFSENGHFVSPEPAEDVITEEVIIEYQEDPSDEPEEERSNVLKL